ncbi:MAG: adenylate/guanylate cyclase domain-containing protein [Actinomycetaceae bacterium]|nr:adenylate/guanylate cyclase domain-containing protein [Actinomycetaceae bacterium]MDY5273901.1 adenylate/guanylate cyclase domain-containing protein [Arcanobacterium sp.]
MIPATEEDQRGEKPDQGNQRILRKKQVQPATSQREAPPTVHQHVERLIGGREKYTVADVVAKTGLTEGNVRRFWQAMGFPFISDESRPIFTDYDVDMLRAQAAMMDHGLTDPDTLNSLIRAQSHLADRMVLWQYEALVEEFEGRFDLDEVSARHAVLEHIDEYEEFLIYQMKYAWRRHMAALMRRSETELENLEKQKSPTASETLELQRALGFVDLVSFTHTSGQLSPHALVDFVQTFEFTCRDVISMYGARVVKMVGDAVLYVADDLDTGVQVVDRVVKALEETPNMPDVRASLVWGGVVSRFGDIFGPSVNLASRLCSVAPVNGILVDHGTAEALYQLDPAGFSIQPYDIPELEGIGTINAAQVKVLKERSYKRA